MTNEQKLDILKRSRKLLDRTYVKWTTDDGMGGHCAQGAILEACNEVCSGAIKFYIFNDLLNLTAKALHPELAGAEAKREHGYTRLDYFDQTPLVYVNNHVGKEAALQLFDVAILELELALASRPDLDVKQPEPALALALTTA